MSLTYEDVFSEAIDGIIRANDWDHKQMMQVILRMAQVELEVPSHFAEEHAVNNPGHMVSVVVAVDPEADDPDTAMLRLRCTCGWWDDQEF